MISKSALIAKDKNKTFNMGNKEKKNLLSTRRLPATANNLICASSLFTFASIYTYVSCYEIQASKGSLICIVFRIRGNTDFLNSNLKFKFKIKRVMGIIPWQSVVRTPCFHQGCGFNPRLRN